MRERESEEEYTERFMETAFAHTYTHIYWLTDWAPLTGTDTDTRTHQPHRHSGLNTQHLRIHNNKLKYTQAHTHIVNRHVQLLLPLNSDAKDSLLLSLSVNELCPPNNSTEKTVRLHFVRSVLGYMYIHTSLDRIETEKNRVKDLCKVDGGCARAIAHTHARLLTHSLAYLLAACSVTSFFLLLFLPL